MRRGRVTASELLEELASDPRYLERQRRLRDEEEKNRRAYLSAAAGLLADLQKAGYRARTLAELRANGDPLAVPILSSWMTRVDYVPLKLDIVHTLGSKWARPHAARPLIDEFRRISTQTGPDADQIRFAIGDSLERVADDSVAQDLFALARDRSHGSTRGLIVAALGNLKRQRARALSTLLELLSDDDVALYALLGLGKLRDASARPHVERFLKHPDESTRREAKKTMAKLR